MINDGAFDDLLRSNEQFAATFADGGMPARAASGLAVITCMDSRIDPFRILGIKAGDAKILRNAGARVTDDVLRTLVLAVHLLGVNRILVMPHTHCRMAESTENEIHTLIYQEFGIDTRSLDFHTDPDQVGALRRDLVKVRSYPFFGDRAAVGGAIFNVETGRLRPLPLDE
ncbi:MAG: carbonic anhydrase [Actinomycetes bacterium]